jgi:restriction system protein
MTDTISSESVLECSDGHRLSRRRRESVLDDIVGVLDTMPWWVVLVLAILTYLFLHQIASADVEHIHHAGSIDATVSQLIIKSLAGAGQYLFPVILLGEAAGAVFAARRLGSRNIREARSNAQRVTRDMPDAMGSDGSGDGLSTARDREKIPQTQRVWSLALLKGIDPRRFAALASHYYREKGIRCESAPFGAGGGNGLKLFQDDSGKPTAIVQCRPWGTPWVGAKLIRSLHGAMASEQLERGIYMTSGAFSKDAKECAQVYGITLIDAKLFLMMIKRLPPPAQERLLSFATQDG